MNPINERMKINGIQKKNVGTAMIEIKIKKRNNLVTYLLEK